MAVLLSKPNKSLPGVLVLSHNEIGFLRNGRRSPIGRYRFLYPIEIFFARKIVSLLKRRYVVGAHIGFRLPQSHDVFSGKYNDFLMATPSLMNGVDPGNMPVFPKTSASFIPNYFGKYKRVGRSWDLIHIATNARYKNWERFGRVAKELLSMDENFQILTLSVHSNEKSRRSLEQLLERTMGNEYQAITHLSHIIQASSKGFSPKFIARLLGDSKVLALFSDNEGTPKVVSEAMAAGCLPAIYSTLANGSAYFPERKLYDMTMDLGTEHNTVFTLARLGEETRDRVALESSKLRGLRASEEELKTFLSELKTAGIDEALKDDFRLTLPSQDMSGSPWLKGRRRLRGTAVLSSIRDWLAFYRYCNSLSKSDIGNHDANPEQWQK